MDQEKQIPSSQTQLHQYRRLFLPSRAELLSYLVISVALLALGALTAFRAWAGVVNSPEEIKAMTPDGLNQVIAKIQESTLLPTLATALFWAAVAGVLYILIWLISNVVIAARNDIVVVEDYIKPSHYRQVKAAWYQTLESLALRLAALASITGMTFLSLGVLLPVYLSQFRLGVLEWQNSASVGYGVLSIVGMIVIIHSYIVFLRLLLLRTRIIS